MAFPTRTALIGPTVPYRGGIAHHTTLLFQALHKDRRVRLYSYRRQYPSWLYTGASDREPSGAFSTDPDIRYWLDPLRPHTWIRTAFDIRRFRADVVVMPWWVAFWAPQTFFLTRAIRRFTSARIVHLCHNVLEHEPSPLKSRLTARAIGVGDVYLCHTAEEADVLQTWFPGAVVRHVDHPSYAALSATDLPSRRPHSPPRLLFFGLLRPYKGLDVLLRAMPRVNVSTGATLKVVGEPFNLDRETRELVESGIRSGFVSADLRYVDSHELPGLFADADLTILPYRSATGCGVAQLALGAGVPVVATRVGSLPDVVHDGRDGILCPPDDVVGLAEAIEKALMPRRYPTLAEGARHASEQNGWSTLVAAIDRAVKDTTPRSANGR